MVRIYELSPTSIDELEELLRHVKKLIDEFRCYVTESSQLGIHKKSKVFSFQYKKAQEMILV